MKSTQISEFSTGFSTEFSTGTKIQHLVSKGTRTPGRLAHQAQLYHIIHPNVAEISGVGKYK